MYNSIHNTLIIGKNIIYLPSCHSTNDIAAELVHKGLAEEGTVVITDNQVGGRGQRGTKWYSEPGQNLTFSFILKPVFLPIAQQFLISQTIALAIFDFLSAYTDQVKIKWPNDIYVSGKKISGTSIENSIQGTIISSTVIGIGINIKQIDFPSSRMTSLAAVLGREVSLHDAFEQLIKMLDRRYEDLMSMTKNGTIHAEYLTKLHGYQQPITFNYQNKMIKGSVTGVADNGRILVLFDGEQDIRDFGLKEIEWVWDN
ncbi:biotin--[acetyl-CoA-carboxylase] ligase [Dyadobacter sp. CY312]|uniref:biotin--[acetyl-CoA-carboxylase] ligase n=1 Tax=Dyadobacter sp. CY312 TaxID=2907303 RepID=UPI001F19E8FE|nr:biotin--[acetyl-CoA-carboxylase] ligase [Dyadobacter sp. CY312]MCE7039814.1 biotin--[acetyl-CoA-carboxylase] ligase [Dyadobacter sp. CY312]